MRTALSSDEKEISSNVIWSFKRDLCSVLKLAQICQDTKITNKHLRSKYISSTSSTSKTLYDSLSICFYHVFTNQTTPVVLCF